MHRLRVLKHAAFVRYKALRYPWSVRFEPTRRAFYGRHPYVFDAKDFRSVGLSDRQPDEPEISETVPRVIWCFWTGDNPLSENRRRCLTSLRRVHAGTEVEVRLVTAADLSHYVLPDQPLHPRYQDLHVVHRSDYLRAYFLHHHGGGYADIKSPLMSWLPAFEHLEASQAWLIGDHKPSRHLSPDFDDPVLERLMKRTSPAHIFQCGMVARRHTPLTTEWMRLLNGRLDAVSPELARNPGVGRRGGDNYPLKWTALLGQLIDPITVKYADKVLHDPSMRLSQSDYL